MKTTLEMINEMQAKGIIGKYAIGGAVGATFYLEPSATLDVDIFVVLPTVASGSLLTVASIYGRILQFLQSSALDRDKLEAILVRHKLVSRWQQFRTKYLET
ncbi:MAG: hypothetical protein WCC87_14375 [Candidatus Korobacteraceae bacterium]